jgi:hypothetical protein
MGFERVFRSSFVSDASGWGLGASWVGVGAELGSHRAGLFVESKSGIAAVCGGQRHEHAESRSSCCGSRDVGSARNTQGAVSLELLLYV